jgi:hypothetical protein
MPAPRRMMLAVDKVPDDDAPETERRQAHFIYRKVAMLQCLPCCGLCGTRRYQTKPFWCLGMRLCRQCVRANMVSSVVLYHRYWLTFNQPVQGHRKFLDAVNLSAFFFESRLTPLQRMDFSHEPLDFKDGGLQTIWYFWMPHLRGLLDMDRLEREGREKQEAAAAIKGFARRCLLLRAITNTTTRRRVSQLPPGFFRKPKGLRSVEFRIHRNLLLGSFETCHERVMRASLRSEDQVRLARSLDRVTPFLFN